MSDNILSPLKKRHAHLSKLTEKLTALQDDRKALAQGIEDHRTFVPDAAKRKLDEMSQAETTLVRKIAEQKADAQDAASQLQEGKAGKVSLLSFRKYFSDEQKQLRANVGDQAKDLRAVQRNLKSDDDALAKLKADMATLRQRLSDHAQFVPEDATARLSTLEKELSRLEADHARKSDEITRMEEKIRPHMEELDRRKVEMSTLADEMAEATRLGKMLASAPDDAAREALRQEFEGKLGVGTPESAISERKKKIQILENSIPKLEQRITAELQTLD